MLIRFINWTQLLLCLVWKKNHEINNVIYNDITLFWMNLTNNFNAFFTDKKFDNVYESEKNIYVQTPLKKSSVLYDI